MFITSLVINETFLLDTACLIGVQAYANIKMFRYS